jgi:hypothetical protein
MRRLGACCAATFALVGALAPAASAQNTPSGHFLTIAARVCDEFTHIRANRARNNIQESLKDLGPTPTTPTASGSTARRRTLRRRMPASR